MPEKKMTMDGNNAAAWVAYAFTEIAAVYPITPSSAMAELTDRWSKEKRKNIFGHSVKVLQMQSEAGAIGAVHGSLLAGALATTFTASQGLLLMIPGMYKIAGELLPSVIHVSARSISTHALSIFGDHSDVMACRQTGYAFLCSCNVQEVMDIGAAAHLSAIEGRVPFVHFFDGFRTSHEISKINVWDYDELKEMVNFDSISELRKKSLNPEHPKVSGTAQNPDIFFQNREAGNTYYSRIPEIVEKYFHKINSSAGTNYELVNYYGASDAEKVIVAMGSVCETITEAIDYLISQGEKVGLVKIRLYRPFPKDRFLASVPKTAKKIAVLDRTKEPGSAGEPLYLDVSSAFYESDRRPLIVGGRYGLSSKDTLPEDILAVYKNLDSEKPIRGFTLAINDDVTKLSLKRVEVENKTKNEPFSCKLWGLGSDGTVGAAKSTVKIIGDNTPLNVQGYFSYDSKKSGGITVAHLRFAEEKIRSAYLVKKADFVACHNTSYIDKYDIVSDVKKGGSFLLNCPWGEEELSEKLPSEMKRCIAENNIIFYTVDANGIAKSVGLENKISTVLQAAFFKVSSVIPFGEAKKHMKERIEKEFALKGKDIVEKNLKALTLTEESINKINIPREWASEKPRTEQKEEHDLGGFAESIMRPINKLSGNELPVSAFIDMPDGRMPLGTSRFEKRGIASLVPVWDEKKCIECNRCSAICPHAAIRPFAMTEEELGNAPVGMKYKNMNGKPYKFSVLISQLDCTSCANCVNICPENVKALSFKPLAEEAKNQCFFDYAVENVSEKDDLCLNAANIKNIQFRRPLLEFSGACAGCGETPYAKLVTQLCGDRAYIANATGCSSIWGASFPSAPYTTSKSGKGPAWASSLFEDNAELGVGMALAAEQMRKNIAEKLSEIKDERVKNAYAAWLETFDDFEKNASASEKLILALEGCKDNEAKAVLELKEFISKKAIWIFGGDGWAYDIGFGGLDHALSTVLDINILVFDTEVYSNTGGQASKATPMGAVAYFAENGKGTRKKRLAEMAMTYENIYVAEVSFGYDMNATLKAFSEALSHHGPSLIIAYSPCINHGIKGGLRNIADVMKNAVDSGYRVMYRYNPRLREEGKEPLIYDEKPQKMPFNDFLMNEGRFYSLFIKDSERAKKLFAEAEENAKEKKKILKEKYDTTN